MINIDTKSISLELFHRVLKEIKNRPERSLSIIDSFSQDQFKSKSKLLRLVDQLRLPYECEVVIFGCWYGSILVPALYTKFSKIVGVDLSEDVIRSAKSNLFHGYANVSFVIGDVFLTNLEQYNHTNLIINTSCEHMPSMKEWPFWHCLPSNSYFAFQSNNMDKIDGHTNCVNSLEEFKNQLPDNFVVLFEDEFGDDRGIRYTLVGQIQQHVEV